MLGSNITDFQNTIQTAFTKSVDCKNTDSKAVQLSQNYHKDTGDESCSNSSFMDFGYKSWVVLYCAIDRSCQIFLLEVYSMFLWEDLLIYRDIIDDQLLLHSFFKPFELAAGKKFLSCYHCCMKHLSFVSVWLENFYFFSPFFQQAPHGKLYLTWHI